MKKEIIAALAAEGVQQFPRASQRSGERPSSHKPFFILCDFPSPTAQAPVDPLLLRLVERLGWQEEDVHYSFALPSYPEKGMAPQGLRSSMQSHFLQELEQVKPHTILCFGARALGGLAQVDGQVAGYFDLENAQTPGFSWHGASYKLWYLSSIQELASWPSWRAAVWKALENLQKK